MKHSYEREYLQYLNKLQVTMSSNSDVTEEELGSSLRKPQDTIFENSRRVIRILCEIYGNHPSATKFSVTGDGKFQIIMNVNSTKGTITVDYFGIRLMNGYDKKEKYVNFGYTDEKIKDKFKKYMKHYV